MENHHEPWLNFDDPTHETIHVTKKRDRNSYSPYDTFMKEKKIKSEETSSLLEANHRHHPSASLLRFRPDSTDYLQITSLRGDVYFAPSTHDDDRPIDTSNYKFDSSYLETPMSQIKKEAEALDQYSSMMKTKMSQKSGDLKNKDRLWVDIYTPKKYLELLSDQKLNRTLFDWIREWDPIVFKKKTDSGKDRPDARIVLLSGPPGIGKTTLAHIIANKAGYDVVEFNASDDRTGERFISKVNDVVENTSISFNTSQKPKCLIIDEIDGTYQSEGRGAIDVLVNLVDEKGSKAKLKRPIICICNDLWSPTLRKLRDRALILKVEPPQINILIDRLHNVCLQEGVKIDNRTLQALCEMNHCDIRSCLNTLQFLSSKSKRIDIDSFLSTSFGQKDMGGNVFEIWKMIFLDEDKSSYLKSIFSSKMENSLRLDKDNVNVNCRSKTEQIISILKNENLDIILNGLHENMLTVKYHDPLLKRTLCAIDWFQFYDTLNTSIYKSQYFSLIQFIPYVAIGIYNNIKANYLEKPFTYPRSERIARTVQKENKSILKSFLTHLSPQIRPFTKASTFIKDILSPLIQIISPSIRSTPFNLLDDTEKKKILDLTCLYIDYGLNFEEVRGSNTSDYPNHHNEPSYKFSFPRKDSGPSFNHQFQLRPPIHILNYFSLREAPMALDKTNDTQRQILSHQITVELNKRQGKSLPESSKISEPSIQERLNKIDKKQETKQVRRDFFGRIIEENVEETNTRIEEEATVKVYFKYHEGKTDAVRRKVLMRDLCG